MSSPKRIGCFGGTFDPPHMGHISLVKEILKTQPIDLILFVVALSPYHKKDPALVTPFKDRVTMTRLALNEIPHAMVCEIEGNRNPETPSYTVQTMAQIQEIYPNDQLVLIIGSDSLAHLHTWFEAEKIVDRYDIITFPRPGYHADLDNLKIHWSPERAEKLYRSVQNTVNVVALASTEIRQDPNGATPFLPPAVANYIAKKKLYTLPLSPLDRAFRTVFKIAMLGIFFYLFMTVAASCSLNSILFQPHPPSPFLKNAELIKVPVSPTENVTLYTKKIPNPKYYVLYFHGNGEDIGDVYNLVEPYSLLECQIFFLDYRGYGRSDGKPTVANYEVDVRAAYHYLTDSLRIPDSQIILHGRSLGGGAAIPLAVENPVRALISESTFLSPYRVVTYYSIFPFDVLSNADAIKKVKCPVLFMQGKCDGVIPFSHGERLFELANPPKFTYWSETAGHNDLEYSNPTAYWQAIARFIQSLSTAPTR